MIHVHQLDHMVLTVRDINETCRFYSTVLGMKIIECDEGRKALAFGRQKINLHLSGSEFSPHSKEPGPGSADLCFLTELPMNEVIQHINQKQIEIIEGPLPKTGATGQLNSVYIRDPDGNLIEIANQLSTSTFNQNHAA